MKPYQIVAYPRTGSTYLTFINHKYNQQNNIPTENVHEFFLSRYQLNDDWYDLDMDRDWRITDESVIIDKIKFLFKTKNYFSLKFIPETINPRFHYDIFTYLQDYDIITINRNPFDAFLSYVYQVKTNWKQSHGGSTPLLDNLNINRFDIIGYLNTWRVNRFFIDSCKIRYTFNYDTLAEEAQDFFGIDTNVDINPMKIDYRTLVNDNVEQMFYDEYETIND